MAGTPISLLDSTHALVALLHVDDTGGHFEGTIDLGPTPPHVKRLFEEYEEVVEGQMFSLLDTLEDKIAALSLLAAFADGSSCAVEDLQVFPSRNAVSLKTSGMDLDAIREGLEDMKAGRVEDAREVLARLRRDHSA